MTSKKDKTETPVNFEDPERPVVVHVHDAANAGKAPSTRWGRVQFDENGDAEIKLPIKDVVKLHEMRWLSEEDQEEYLGISQEVQQTVVPAEDIKRFQEHMQSLNVKIATLETDKTMLMHEVEALKAENARIANELAAAQNGLNKIEAAKKAELEAAAKADADAKAAAAEADAKKAKKDASK